MFGRILDAKKSVSTLRINPGEVIRLFAGFLSQNYHYNSLFILKNFFLKPGIFSEGDTIMAGLPEVFGHYHFPTPTKSWLNVILRANLSNRTILIKAVIRNNSILNLL